MHRVQHAVLHEQGLSCIRTREGTLGFYEQSFKSRALQHVCKGKEEKGGGIGGSPMHAPKLLLHFTV